MRSTKEAADAERKGEEMAPFPGQPNRELYRGPPSCEGLGPEHRLLSLPSPQTTAQRCEKKEKKQGDGWQRRDRCTFHTLTTGGAQSSFTLTNFLLKLPQLAAWEGRSRGHMYQNSEGRPLARWLSPRAGPASDLVWGCLGPRLEHQTRVWLGTMTKALPRHLS